MEDIQPVKKRKFYITVDDAGDKTNPFHHSSQGRMAFLYTIKYFDDANFYLSNLRKKHDEQVEIHFMKGLISKEDFESGRFKLKYGVLYATEKELFTHLTKMNSIVNK